MNQTMTHGRRNKAVPYLFSYDISSNRPRRQVLRCLRRWRVDGQLSVHETWMSPAKVHELAVELLDLVDLKIDRLLTCRLNRRGDGPVYRLFGPAPGTVVAGPGRPRALPATLHNGWYLLAYDVADPKRLQRIQRKTSAATVFLQRSVYLFNGSGARLGRLLGGIAEVLDPGKDDLRVYALSGPRDLWFLCGPTPPLPETGEVLAAPGLWPRLRHWLGL